MGIIRYNLIDNYDLQGSVVEIGTDRAEGSTGYLSQACKVAGLKFYTVDFDLAIEDQPDANQFRMTGEEFFAKHFPMDEKICFAYLDGFDWTWEQPPHRGDYIPPYIPKQIARYKEYGLEMNNENSQQSHLILTKAVAKHAAKKCVILFDDTFVVNADGERGHGRDENWFSGKGGTAVPWLVEQGWYNIPVSANNDKYGLTDAVAFRNWK